jgi:hypothetical protein
MHLVLLLFSTRTACKYIKKEKAKKGKDSRKKTDEYKEEGNTTYIGLSLNDPTPGFSYKKKKERE